MNKTELQFVDLIKFSIHNGTFFDFNQNINWNKMYELCYKNRLDATVYVKKNYSDIIPSDLNTIWKTNCISNICHQGMLWNGLQRIIDNLNNNKIRYILFKGEVLSDLYPNKLTRFSSDSDIFIDAENMDRVHQIMSECGYTFFPEPEFSNPMVSYFRNQEGHSVEIHNCLYEDYEGPQIDKLVKYDFTNPKSCITLLISGREVVTLGYEDHLIYLLFHIIKHFTLEGMRVNCFVDITLYVEKYIDHIDLLHFWNRIEYLGYKTFVEMFFSICIQYFGMDSSILKERHASYSKSDLEDLLSDFIYVGDKDNKRMKNWQLTGIMTQYLVGENKKLSNDKTIRNVLFIFPSPSRLDNHYIYAKKCVVLLPVAWVHRAIRNIKIFKKENGNTYRLADRVSAVDKRLDLLKLTKLDEII